MFVKKENRKGFTLIELLVVIAVIAMLMAIVIPALGKAKIYAQKVVCKNNLRQLSMGILLYADQNNNEVPVNTVWNGGLQHWFWDASVWMTDQIMDYGGIVPEVFYCPSVKDKQADDKNMWQFSFPNVDESTLSQGEDKFKNYRVLSYIFLTDLVEMNPAHNDFQKSKRNMPVADANFQWIRKLTRLRNTGTREMVMDGVLSGLAPSYGSGARAFESIEGGGMGVGVYDRTNHLARQSYDGTSCPQNPAVTAGKQPDGANVGFADGHVDWRQFEDMQRQINGDTDFYW